MLRAADMAVGIDTREHNEVCPNDATPMRRKTWKEDALDADRVAREQMARAEGAEAELAEQDAKIAALTEQRDAAEDRQLERGAQLSELHGALAERDAEDAAANSDVCDIPC